MLLAIVLKLKNPAKKRLKWWLKRGYFRLLMFFVLYMQLFYTCAVYYHFRLFFFFLSVSNSQHLYVHVDKRSRVQIPTQHLLQYK